jgi:hypothetical protein
LHIHQTLFVSNALEILRVLTLINIMEDITWNIDNNDKFKVSIKLGSGKEIKIEDSTSTGIKDLTILELQEANKKLSETISLLNQMLK